MKLNTHYLELEESYLFSTINRRIRAFQAAQPLCPTMVKALGEAVAEMPSGLGFLGPLR